MIESKDAIESRRDGATNPNQRFALEDWECHLPIDGNFKRVIDSQDDAGSHYRYEYRGIKIDPYRIADVYHLTDFAMQTILKKVLRAGRAHKDLVQDLKDIICAAQRKLEMIEEDEANT